jgi:hypothetical protein
MGFKAERIHNKIWRAVTLREALEIAIAGTESTFLFERRNDGPASVYHNVHMGKERKWVSVSCGSDGYEFS